MDRFSQLRGEPGGSRDSTLDSTASPSEAYITANESSKYFSVSEEDSSFAISPVKDVSLASSAEPDKSIPGNEELISNLSPIPKKNDLLDSYKLGKQIEAANILSGGVDIFDDNDNSYDGDELVIDDNVVEIDDKANAESMDSEAVASKDTEVKLQIDGVNVNAIDIGNGLYLYRKDGEEELAAVQIVMDNSEQPTFNFLKVRENAEGNLEVYEEIEIEVPIKQSQGKSVEKSASHVPIKDINKVINDQTGNKSVERKIPLKQGTSSPVTNVDSEVSSKVVLPETKPEVNLFGKTMKLNETRKSPVIHSTPNKEGIPLTKTMVDLQLHPNRHLDKVKTIEVHTDNSNKRPSDLQTKSKDEDLKLEHNTKELEKQDNLSENKIESIKKSDDFQPEITTPMENQNIEQVEVDIADNVEPPKDTSAKIESGEMSKKVEETQKCERKTTQVESFEKTAIALEDVKENLDNKIKENGKIAIKEKSTQGCDKLSYDTICDKDDNSNLTSTKDTQNTIHGLEVNKPDNNQVPCPREASKTENKKEMLVETSREEKNNECVDIPRQSKNVTDNSILDTEHSKTSNILENPKAEILKAHESNLEIPKSDVSTVNNQSDKEKDIEKKGQDEQSKIETVKSPVEGISKDHEKTNQKSKDLIDNPIITTVKDQDRPILKGASEKSAQNKDISGNVLQNVPKNLNKEMVIEKAPQNILIIEENQVNKHTSEKSTQNIPKQKPLSKEMSEQGKYNTLKEEYKQKDKEILKHTAKDLVKQNNREVIEESTQSSSVEKIKQGSRDVSETLLKQTDLKQQILNLEEVIKDQIDKAKGNVKINDSVATKNCQSKPDIKREMTNLEQQPIKISNIAVPFGKWTEANRQEFLNKIKETKIPTTSSNTKSLKQANDLNRRDVLQKIDSQRQSACNALSLKTQEAKLNIKNEVPTFVNKPTAPRESKVPVKPELLILKNKPIIPKTNVKPEITQTGKKLLPKATVTTSSVNKQEVPQRKEINNQDLIDKTIEGIINRAVTTTHKDTKSLTNEVIKQQSEIVFKDNIKPKEKPSSTLDAIESKMNELHGIPFIERPPHELPKVYHRDIKTYAKVDKKLPAGKVNKKSNVPLAQPTQEAIIDLDSEEEVIEHEPITGDINLKAKEIVPKLVPIQSVHNTPVQRNIDTSKKETIITEKDFEQFARRNSITYENRLTVSFESNKQHNFTQSVVEKDLNPKITKNEIALDLKAVKPPKQKPITASNPMNTIQITSKIVPVIEDTYHSKLQLAYQNALTTKRKMESPLNIIEDKPVKVVFMESHAPFPQNQLNVQGRDLSPTKKQILENESITNSAGESLDSIDDIKAHDETKIKTKHQRKQVLTPVETPELELIVPSEQESPKKKRKIEDTKVDKTSKGLVPKKSYLLGRSTIVEDSSRQQDSSQNKETASQNNAVVSHKDAASAIDNLVKAAELIETQSETLKASPAVVYTSDNSTQVATVKRGRGRPRKYPLAEGTPAKSNASSPQKKPRLIDAKQKKDSFTTDEDDTDEDELMIRENWTMGKINENIVCPICNKLFRSENVVFKHVKHCTGPSPNRSDSEKRSSRRSRLGDSDSKSMSSKYDDMDVDSDDSTVKKTTPKKRKSKDNKSGDKEDIIVIEDTPIKKVAKCDKAVSQESKKVTKTKAQYKTSVLSCEYCGKTFRQLSYLVSHKLLHKKETTNKPPADNAQVQDKSVFCCEVCKKEFRKLHHLVQHRLIHNAPSRPSRKSSYEQSVDNKGTKDQDSKQNEDLTAAFRCEPCDKSFRKLHHLVEHRETHCLKKQKSTSQAQATVEKGVPTPPYKCDICKKTFRKLHNLTEHREQHVETSSEKSDDVKSVKSSLSAKDIIHECPLCYMVFPNEHSLNKHTTICQRKKKQNVAKQAKQLEENENDVTENSETGKEKETEIEPEQTGPDVKNNEEVKIVEKLDANSLPVVEKVLQDPIDKEISSSKDTMKHPGHTALPGKRDSEEAIKTVEVAEDAAKIPDKVKKVEVKSEDDLPLKVITAAKKKMFAKEKSTASVAKRDISNVTNLNVSKSAAEAAESSDDEEIRYMLNPDFIEENLKGKLFMKVKAKKRSSLQIERPNSKDLVKRRTSLQHPPKIPRLKAKLIEKSDVTVNHQTNTSRNTKGEPSVDSDDSDVKYSFPEKPPQASGSEKTPNKKGKLVGDKRKVLSSIARRKSLGKSVTAKHKEKISTPKEIKRCRAVLEHRCDCGQLFNSAALLARHTSLAHTPPRVRRRRLPDPPQPPTEPAAVPRKRASAGKPAASGSRKSSVRSDTANPVTPELPAAKTAARSATRRSIRQVDRNDSPKMVLSSLKSRKSSAHRGVPVPEKMKKIADKLRK